MSETTATPPPPTAPVEVIDGVTGEVLPAVQDAPPAAPPAPAVQPSDSGLLAMGSTPREAIAYATEVADLLTTVLRSRRMLTRIGNNEHVNVEGWTTLGAMTGHTAAIEWCRPGTDLEGRPGYEARAVLYDGAGRVVGAGEGWCSRYEDTGKRGDKASWEDYALRGMAQTRALSRAYRSRLGFIVQLAGFPTTPADEMHSDHGQDAAQGNLSNGSRGGRPAAGSVPPTLPPDPAALSGNVSGWVQPKDGGGFNVKLRGDGDAHAAAKAAVQSLQGRKWNAAGKVWEVWQENRDHLVSIARVFGLRLVAAGADPEVTPPPSPTAAAAPASGASSAPAAPPAPVASGVQAPQAPQEATDDAEPSTDADARVEVLLRDTGWMPEVLRAWLFSQGVKQTSSLSDEDTWERISAAAASVVAEQG